jgi:molybdopterin synthase catalytic subunit
MIPITIRLQTDDFDIAAEVARLRAGTDVGAIVTFSGICRDEGGRLAALELEHYPGMAEAEIERIAREAATRWPVTAITVVHRHGRIAPGDNIVLVVTASSHRQAAFEAASFLMDFLKTRAPFWKKEHAASGTADKWVAAKADDDAAAERWRRKG